MNGRRGRQEVEADLKTIEYGMCFVSVFSTMFDQLNKRYRELLIELAQIDCPVEKQREAIKSINMEEMRRR